MNNQLKWKAALGLITVYVAIIFNLFWIWGVLLLVWVFQDIKAGVTHLLEPVSRLENPVLFWLIEITWLLLALLIFALELGLISFQAST